METEQYIGKLADRLSRNFILEKDCIISGKLFALCARYSQMIGRTFITKKDIIDRFETRKIILAVSCRDEQEAMLLCSWMKKPHCLREIAAPHGEHYYTLVNLVLLFEGPLTHKMVKTISTFLYTRYFRFFLHGWAQVGLTGVSLQDGTVVAGRKVSEMKKVFDFNE